jgi:hypothetical protein
MGKPNSQWATQAAIVLSAGNIPQITIFSSLSDWALSRRFVPGDHK